MAKDNTIRIQDFQRGISPSPVSGFQNIRCLNILDEPGTIFPNKT